MLLSLGFHVILLTGIGLLYARTISGSGTEIDRPVGIAMVHKLPDRDRYVESAEVVPTEQAAEQTSAASGDPSSASAPPADLIPPIDLEGILSEIRSTPSPVSGTGIAGETSLAGDAFESKRPPGSNHDSGETTTTLFGVSGSGSHFVYVFDRSDSMNGNGGLPLRSAKRELIKSLRTLTEKQRFQIIFYNDQPQPFQTTGMPTQLMQGEKAILTRAERYVDSVTAFGGTEHDSALKMALRMGPDVIFFLTDARIPRLSSSQLAEIRRRAENSGTTIHAIEFGAEPLPPAESFLKDLAAQNLGQYQYVDVRMLGNGEQATP